MRTVQSYVILGSLISSLFMATFCFIITADAAQIAQSPSTSPGASQNSVASPSTSITGSPNVEEYVECKISENYPQSIQQWCQQITRVSAQYNLDPNLIAAVMLQESGGQHLAYSKSGAVGLMQVMPRDGLAASFMCKNGPCFSNRPSIEELQDPDYIVDYGTRMLSGLITRLGNVREALKSYGPMDMGYRYADKVLAIYENYQS
jgi:soluble lytic murein transglycosylase-like protein